MTAPYPPVDGTRKPRLGVPTHADCGQRCHACLSVRFWAKVEKADGCWIWRGKTTDKNYGQFAVDRRYRNAHRVAYELAVGPIPTGLEIDHLCRVRNCVNPAHLEAVTHQVNTSRGLTVTAANSRKTHCPQNHPYSPENTMRTSTNGRRCRTCTQARGKRS